MNRTNGIAGGAADGRHHGGDHPEQHRRHPRGGGSTVAALETGAFYASTGVELDDIVVADRRLEVHIRPLGSFRYTTRFIGAGGRVLLETGANPAVFELQGPEVYVRAVVHDSGGWRAWVQPVFVAGG